MCFSAVASFTASIVLFPAGVFAIIRAYKANKHYMLFASIPFLFAFQQFIEGIIWHYLDEGNLSLAHEWSYLYLFFSFAFWPCFFPACIYAVEETSPSHNKLFYVIIIGTVIGALMYLPILFGISPFATTISKHSISYYVTYSTNLTYLYSIGYLSVLLASLFLIKNRQMKIFGILLLISFIISSICYLSAFTSVWCFFAAILSLYIVRIVYTLK